MGAAVNDLFHFAVIVDSEEMYPLEVVPDFMENGIGSGGHTADDTADFVVLDVLTDGNEGIVGIEKLHCGTVLTGNVEQMLQSLWIGRVCAVLNVEDTKVSSGDIGNYPSGVNQTFTLKLVGDQDTGTAFGCEWMDCTDRVTVIFHRIIPICCNAACGGFKTFIHLQYSGKI